MRRARVIAPLVIAASIGGCSAADTSVDLGPGGDARGGSIGVLHVDRVTPHGGSTGASTETGASPESSTVLHAAFARYDGIDAPSVLSLLGSGAGVELGQCRIADPGAESEPLGAADADVELVDVGALRVRVADTEAELTPRTFPEVASVLAGVFYAGDAALAAPTPDVDEYRFAAGGSAEVGAFEVIVPAPATPSGIALLGADGTGGVLDERVAEVRTAAPLEILWDGEDARDVIEIELVASTRTLACAVPDEGSLRVGAELLSALGRDPVARLVVRRVRVVAFDAPGMDVAYARVGASRAFSLSLR